MTRFEQTIQLVERFLRKKPFPGYAWQLADEIGGISTAEVYAVVGYVRRAEWIEQHGWTIPYVGQGQGRKRPYEIVDDPAGVRPTLQGGRIRFGDLLTSLRNVEAHLEFVLPLASAGDRKALAVTIPAVRGVVQMVEVLAQT